jgi:hypothetical protein
LCILRAAAAARHSLIVRRHTDRQRSCTRRPVACVSSRRGSALAAALAGALHPPHGRPRHRQAELRGTDSDAGHPDCEMGQDAAVRQRRGDQLSHEARAPAAGVAGVSARGSGQCGSGAACTV